MDAEQRPDLRGADLIKSLLPTAPKGPGVYRMLDSKGDILYIGKAKSIRKRVISYTKMDALTARLKRMVSLTRSMEFISTSSEVEALLLEANMIKRLRPGFNIVLRDDKSFPHIALRLDHEFPMIAKHRGRKRDGVEYFGPFASAGAVNETMNALLRAFPLRNCSDAIFSARTRPCLQYQIKRCSAPCVGRISQSDYAKLVAQVRKFLAGQSREIRDQLTAQMNAAAESLDYETAAVVRDRIKALTHVGSQQGINSQTVADADVIGLHVDRDQVCVQVFFYRSGRNYGNRAYYPAHSRGLDVQEMLSGFIGQFYAERAAPPLILVSQDFPESALLAEALAVKAGRKVAIAVPKRGEKRQLIEIAETNAKQALARKLAESDSHKALLASVAETFDLPAPPERIEVYDNSHIQGSDAIGAFIVAGPDGFDKKAYRTFNIKDAALTPGDDFAMMREVLSRRFARLAKAVAKDDTKDAMAQTPDLVIIDGGAGQLNAVHGVMAELGFDDLPLLAIAKGPDRNAGRERFFIRDRAPLSLDPRDPVLYFMQRLRDEAHRFAISTHRSKRTRKIGQSKLDSIPGIGAKRKKALLVHFGSARGVEEAGLRDLEQVQGIDKGVAQRIYDYFHETG